METADAIVVASPAGDEVILASFEDGVQLIGQPFAVVTGLKGSVVAGSEITVLRTVLSTAPALSTGSNRGEAPFVLQRYVLGIRPSATYPAWVTVGGPSGQIGFADDGTAVALEEGVAVQEEVAGKTLAEIIDLVHQVAPASGDESE